MHKSRSLRIISTPSPKSLDEKFQGHEQLIDDQVGPEHSCAVDAELNFADQEPASQVYTTRDQRRSRRKRAVRARTVDMSRFGVTALEVGRRLQPELEVKRPIARADCSSVPRPCPFVSCRHHLYLDVSPRTGSIKLNFPDLDVDELVHSCSLDVAENGGLTAEDLGEVMNITRERVRQLERKGLDHASEQLAPFE